MEFIVDNKEFMDYRHLLHFTNVLKLSNKHIEALKAITNKISDYEERYNNLIWTILI